MRRAYELAFATAFTLAGARPVFLACEEITFRRPVDVGDLVCFRSVVVHTAPHPGSTTVRRYAAQW
jgi:acyl-coenzyme A thioesterase 9